MANEHVTSGGYTFSQHLALARAWNRYNGGRGTERQSLRVLQTVSAPVLVQMLRERRVGLPIGCERPVVEVR